MKIFILIALLASSLCLTTQAQEINLNELAKLPDSELKSKLTELLTSSHRPITYKEANKSLFIILDRHNDKICGVYSPDECIDVLNEEIPSPKIMNIEHTWPQSEGANGTAKSDLHHLFIASSPTNSIRSSLPFCDVEKMLWTNEDSKRGHSRNKEHCFEPPANHKGNVARAMFYFALRYKADLDPNQENYLREWHEADPVDDTEVAREQKIFNIQKNHNLFILYPELVDLVDDF